MDNTELKELWKEYNTDEINADEFTSAGWHSKEQKKRVIQEVMHDDIKY